MGGVTLGPMPPDSQNALWRGKRQTGGALIAAGAASWLVHSILMIVGLVAIFSISLTDIDSTTRSLTTSITAFIGAMVAVLLAAFVLAAGLIMYQGGTPGLSWQDWYSAQVRGVTAGTRGRAKVGAAFVAFYGVLGIAVVAIYFGMSNAANSSDFQGVLNGFTAILVIWIVASIVLIAAGVFLASFLNSLRVETASLQSFSGAGFLGYAITNAVGVLLLAVPLLMLVSNPFSASFGLVIPFLIGGVMELLVVPIVGIVVFSLLISHALHLRKLQPGARYPAPYYPPPVVPTYAGPAFYPAPAPAPFAAPVAAPLGRVEAGSPLPPPPASPVPPESGPPATSPSSGEGWVLRLEGQIADMERAVNEQKEFLYQVERSLVEGRIDNATYAEIVKNRSGRIADLEKQIADKRGLATKKPIGDSQGEPPVPPENP